MASFTILTGYCPNKQCYQDGECKVLCIFVIVFLIIETTGFVLPCIIHGATAYFLVKETYDAFSGLEEYKRLDKEDKGALVVSTIFSILSTLIVLVLEFFGAVFLVVNVVPKASTKTSNATKIEVKLNKKNINYNESKDSKVAQRSASFE